MATADFAIVLETTRSAQEVFDSINNVRGWWSEALEGGSDKLHDEFVYRHEDLHYSKQRLEELVPGKRVVWLVTDSHLSFVGKSGEWTGTKVIFEIAEKDGRTKLHFKHQGLLPSTECYGACSNGWSYYIHQSLLPLIETGIGMPDRKKKLETTLN
jgi:Activator of Hsp90 ATPase homolog 1-like protein